MRSPRATIRTTLIFGAIAALCGLSTAALQAQRGRNQPPPYTPAKDANACSPANAPTRGFPVNPGAAMPAVNGCSKQDYTVLIVVGVPATH